MGSVGPTTTPNQIPSSAMPLLSPSALLHAHLSQDPPLRPSNRLPNQPRPIHLNIGSLTHTNGSALIKIGDTTVVAGIRAEILDVKDIPSFRVRRTNPAPIPTNDDTSDSDTSSFSKSTSNSSPDESPLALHNLLVPNLELSTGSSPSHPANTPPSIEAQSLSTRLLSLLLTSRLIRLSDLEIWHQPPPPTPETRDLGLDSDPQLKAYWVLYIDILCLSHAGSGSVFDAAWLATIAALHDTLLQMARWNVDEMRVVCSVEVKEGKRLRLRGGPVGVSWGVFVPERRDVGMAGERATREGTRVLVDLDALEEECCQQVGCVVVDYEGTVIVRLEKSGGGVVGVSEVGELVEVAAQRWRDWQSVLEGALKDRG